MSHQDLGLIENLLSESLIPAATSGCMFCDVEKHLIVAETSNFYLIKDKYPITKDHLMIISKDHYGCMGELHTSYFKELYDLRKKITLNFKEKKFIGYEHGRAGHCVKLKGSEVTCHHFHLHYVPIEVDIRNVLKKTYEEKPTDLQKVKSLFERFGEYLYFENTDREGFFYPASLYVAPHLLRTLICEAAHMPHQSDWEKL